MAARSASESGYPSGGIWRCTTTRSSIAARSARHAAADDKSVPDMPPGRWHEAHALAKTGASTEVHASTEPFESTENRCTPLRPKAQTSPVGEEASFASGDTTGPASAT